MEYTETTTLYNKGVYTVISSDSISEEGERAFSLFKATYEYYQERLKCGLVDRIEYDEKDNTFIVLIFKDTDTIRTLTKLTLDTTPNS